MNSAEDFLLLLLYTHTVAAVNVILSYYPTDNSVELARRIVVNFVTIPNFKKSKGHDSDNCSSMDRSSEIRTQCEDGVHCYGIEFLSLSLIWHGFHDSIREGDGDRILRYWKILLDLQIKETMLKKQSTYCSNTTTCFQIASESNYYGVGVLTQEDIKVPIYHVTFIWST